MAVFGMFAADDLARMVIKKMEETEATRQIAETVAHEFKNAGIAFADSSSGSAPDPIGCQHNCDNMLLGKLQSLIPASSYATMNACIGNCVKENQVDPDGLQNCIKEKCINPELPAGLVIRAKTYLECCYSACDSGQTGTACKL